MMHVKIQSNLKNDLDLFFSLLEGVPVGLQQFEHEGVYTAMFKIDFKRLQELVTKHPKFIKSRIKQDLSVNHDLIALVGLYRSKGTSFQKIADKLNKEGYKNSRGSELNRMQILRLYNKYMQESKNKL